MSKKQPLIIWEKWIDPFGRDTDEAKWTDYNNDITDIDALISDSQDEEPEGLIPYNEHTASGKIFNFWLGHTNFNISKKISNLIESCDGVEILDIFTRYRFRVGIGKCFNDSDTMKNINDIVYESVENNI
jgi:hypothetical protein